MLVADFTRDQHHRARIDGQRFERTNAELPGAVDELRPSRRRALPIDANDVVGLAGRLVLDDFGQLERCTAPNGRRIGVDDDGIERASAPDQGCELVMKGVSLAEGMVRFAASTCPVGSSQARVCPDVGGASPSSRILTSLAARLRLTTSTNSKIGGAPISRLCLKSKPLQARASSSPSDSHTRLPRLVRLLGGLARD
jgi:hypothetical protein